MAAKDAGGEVIALLVSWAVTTAFTFAIVIADERYLLRRPARLERAWPRSSRDAAIVVFGVLSLPVHFAKTRGGKGFRGAAGYLLGLVMGVVAICIVAVAAGLLVSAVDTAFGLSAS
jgi:hypothetical protein